jgi:hypothetical protein
MAEVNVADLLRVSRDVARVAGEQARFRAELLRDVDAASDHDPFATARYVSGKTTYDALVALSPSAHDVPLRHALLRWVYAFLQARIGRELDVAWARAADAREGRYEGDAPRRVSYREAWRGVVGSRTVGDARLWLRATEDVAPKLAAIAKERAARRKEVARRAGRGEAVDLAIDAPHAALHAAATALLDATDDVARATREGASPEETIVAAVARDAPDGWPARMSGRWLEDVFGELARGARVDLPVLPAALGASSFARAVTIFGRALPTAFVPRELPFALAHDPQPIAAHRLGFTLGALVARADFQRTALGVSRRAADAQARVLARTALLEARVVAARWLARNESFDFEGQTARLFGAPLARAFAGAWPASRDDDSARLVALVTAHALGRELVERFDVDWWKNPRAAAELRTHAHVVGAHASQAVIPSGDDLASSALATARAFEEALA